MEALIESLNPAQREAVLYNGGPMLVVAGAGSGKTRVITCKVAYLIRQGLYRPEEILAVTFTNKAAKEMQERVAGILGPAATQKPLVCTFHSFCARFLRREIGVLGYPAQFTIYDTGDQESLMKRLLKDHEAPPAVTADLVLGRISQAKIRQLDAHAYAEAYDREHDEWVAKMFPKYEAAMKAAGALDFDDLILKTNEILEKHPEARRRVNARYRYILVDEFQDTNPPQFVLIRHLTASGNTICVVGDEDQSIYGFRGAILANILHFERDFPGSRVFKLEENYRCSRNILRAGASLIAHNRNRREKDLRTGNPAGDPVGFFEAENPAFEAGAVSRAVKKLTLGEPRASVGVLYRTNFQARRVEDAFRGQAIRYRIVGGLSFYSRKEIKDVAAYLKLLANRNDTVSFLRAVNTPPRGIGDKTIELLRQGSFRSGLSLREVMEVELDRGEAPGRARTALTQFRTLLDSLERSMRELPLGEYVETVVRDSGYESHLRNSADPEDAGRLENVQEFVTMAAEHEKEGGTIETFLDRLALFTDAEDEGETARVVLMTLHGAKGLEFDYVFVIGLEEGLVPHSRASVQPEDVEEERRLLYVGMTRARKRLVLGCSKMRPRAFNAPPEPVKPSRFLAEIAADCLTRVDPFSLAFAPGAGRFAESAPRLDGGRPLGIRTFDTAEDIADFFGKKGAAPAGGPGGGPRIVTRASAYQPAARPGGGKPAAPAGRPKIGPPPKPLLSTDPSAQPRPRKGDTVPLPGVKPGDRVRHAKFGAGVVLRAENTAMGRKLTISFLGCGVKQLLEQVAGLEKE